ncbi:MAG: hypothetical protein N6V41_00965, partial [Candidatus Portiera aleyrodidarum]|nr:hypothetical protein [Candidatus Portiera aleyrodidarum]
MTSIPLPSTNLHESTLNQRNTRHNSSQQQQQQQQQPIILIYEQQQPQQTKKKESFRRPSYQKSTELIR